MGASPAHTSISDIQPQDLEETGLCCPSHPLCGILWWQPQDTSAPLSRGTGTLIDTQQGPETTGQARVSQEGGWLRKLGPPSLLEGRKLRGKTPLGEADSCQGAPLDPQRSCSKRWFWRLLPVAPIWLPNRSARGAICPRVPPPTFPHLQVCTHLQQKPHRLPTPSHAPSAAGGPVETRCVSKAFIQTSYSFILGAKSLLSLAL